MALAVVQLSKDSGRSDRGTAVVLAEAGELRLGLSRRIEIENHRNLNINAMREPRSSYYVPPPGSQISKRDCPAGLRVENRTSRAPREITALTDVSVVDIAGGMQRVVKEGYTPVRADIARR